MHESILAQRRAQAINKIAEKLGIEPPTDKDTQVRQLKLLEMINEALESPTNQPSFEDGRDFTLAIVADTKGIGQATYKKVEARAFGEDE